MVMSHQKMSSLMTSNARALSHPFPPIHLFPSLGLEAFKPLSRCTSALQMGQSCIPEAKQAQAHLTIVAASMRS